MLNKLKQAFINTIKSLIITTASVAVIFGVATAIVGALVFAGVPQGLSIFLGVVIIAFIALFTLEYKFLG